MAKAKNKKKSSKKSTTVVNSDTERQNEQSNRKRKVPFEISRAYELRAHTVDELIALTRATDEWTSEVEKLCASKMNICLYGSRKERDNTIPTKEIEHISIDLVFDEPKMREEKMIQLTQEVIRLFPNLYGFLVFYHPRLNHFFPLLIEQIMTTSDINVHMLSIGKAPIEPMWRTKWWTTISSIPELRRVFLRDPGELPPIIHQYPLRLAHARVVRIVHFDWDLVPLFKQFGPSLVALDFEVNNSINCDIDELDRLLEANPRIGVNLRKLHLGHRTKLVNSAEEQSKFLRLVVKRFPKLQVLHIKSLMKLHFEEIFSEIAKLPRLEELCIVALWDKELIPKSIDHLEPNQTLVRLRIWNPIDDNFNEFERIMVQLFPNLRWVGVSSSWKRNVDKFISRIPEWYDRARTKYQVKWYDYVQRNEKVFEDEESPMDAPTKWTGWRGE